MIELQHITKTYEGFTAVDDVSLSVEAGENMVFLGRSGCGKTTLLRMINRLIEPDAGEIRINGERVNGERINEERVNGKRVNGKRIDAQDPSALRRTIGYVLQNTGLFPHYTIAENVAIVPRLLGWDRQRILERSRDLLAKLHLPPDQYLSAYPQQLSGGQQQRVGLARALAANPPVLLMDEPFGALDPITRASVKRDFMQLDELKNTTIILVTHDVQEAFELGDRICLLDRGRIVQCGKPEELLHRPATDYVRAFFDDQRFLLEADLIDVNDHAALIDAFSQFKRSAIFGGAADFEGGATAAGGATGAGARGSEGTATTERASGSEGTATEGRTAAEGRATTATTAGSEELSPSNTLKQPPTI